jgi:CubicO group peptidase (beta-lactamase class C family)
MRVSRPVIFAVLVGCSRAAETPKTPAVDHVARVTASLTPAVQVKGAAPAHYDIKTRMEHYRTPGVSVAVVDSGRIVWARGFGVKEAGGTDSITPTTLFEAGSISKPVAATITLRLVQDGNLSLDENVNAYLKSWKVPDNRFTAKEKVTLRRILSHSAGLTVHGFPGYSVTDSIPTLPQVLDGAKPANTPPVRVDTFPGAIWRYSGGGTTIQQLLLVDVTGKPFPALAKEMVLDPIGMTQSTYEQPIPAARASETSAAHHSDGVMVPGRFHVYPEMAAAGLWTTPTDLLKWAMEIAAARAGKSTKVLSQQTATDMLTVQKAPVGLGPFLEGAGRSFHFGHGGADEGFHAELVYFPETGQGAAVMVNSDGGSPMIREILYAIAAEYGWPDFGPRTIETIAQDSTARAGLVGVYEVTKPFAVTITISDASGKLMVDAPAIGARSEIAFLSPTHLVMLDGGNEFDIERAKDGTVTALKLGSFRVPRRPGGKEGT